MTRILYWNIENFGINKINKMSRKRNIEGQLLPDFRSQDRRDLISKHFNLLAPDIVVVVEVSTGASGGDLIPNTGGLLGCTFLLNHLRGTPPYNGQDWRLVPPLVVGQGGVAESVAVFFRGTTGGVTRYFTGPNRYTGGYNGTSFDPAAGGAVAVAYPNAPGQPDFLTMLAPGVPPVVRTVPAQYTAGYNAGQLETQLAARISFARAVPPHALVDFGTFRQPYMITFTETGGFPAPRLVTIFACHAPPTTFGAKSFMNRLPTMADVAGPLGAGETKVICGDFNLNLLNPNGTDANPYAGLTNIGYTRLLAPPVPGPAPPIPDAYKGYFATHIKPKPSPSPGNANDLFLWSSNAAQSPYPGYGYIGSSFIDNFYSIDNVLVTPTAAGQTLTVVNSVVGTPMNAVQNPPGNPPLGVDNFNNDVRNIIGWPDTPNADIFQIGMAKHRVGWQNYRHIRNTSDHFALLATI